jgi:hypothetical protein
VSGRIAATMPCPALATDFICVMAEKVRLKELAVIPPVFALALIGGALQAVTTEPIRTATPTTDRGPTRAR